MATRDKNCSGVQMTWEANGCLKLPNFIALFGKLCRNARNDRACFGVSDLWLVQHYVRRCLYSKHEGISFCNLIQNSEFDRYVAYLILSYPLFRYAVRCGNPWGVLVECSSPLLRPWARRWRNHLNLWRMASATPDLVAGHRCPATGTGWTQRHMCVNNLPKDRYC